jgi:hypothetical protein
VVAFIAINCKTNPVISSGMQYAHHQWRQVTGIAQQAPMSAILVPGDTRQHRWLH